MPAVFDPLLFGATALDVMAAGRATPQGIAARQQVRLARLLDILARGSTLYRPYLRDYLDTHVQLQDLPVTSKSMLMHRFDAWVTDPQLKLADLRAFVADPNRIAQPYLGRYLVWESSGSGGESGIFVQDTACMAVYDALESLRRSPPRPLQRWLDPLCLGERIAFVGATNGHFASFVSVQRLQALYPWMQQTLRCFSILQPNAALIEALNTFNPTIIATYPTVACMLADAKARGTLTASPREVWTGGETLSENARTQIQTRLDCQVRNSYGASEFLTLAWECAHGAMHANTDWAILEPVDENFKAVPPGETAFTTLLTNLVNTVQPLVRYDLGDQISISTTPCACGSPLPVISVMGRHDDPLVLRGRNGTPAVLLPLAVTTALEEDAGVFDFQIEQQDDHTLLLRVAQDGGEGADALTRSTAVLQAFAQTQGAAPLNIHATHGAALAHGRSGKVQRVIAARTSA